MAKRCSPISGCNKPRSRYWKKALGVDWFDHNSQGGGEEPEPEAVTPEAFGEDTVFFFDASRTKTMWQEVSTGPASANNVGVPLNLADEDDDPVGFIYDLGQNAMYLTNTSGSTTRPTLKSDATRHSFLDFDGTEYLMLQNSTVILRPAHQAAAIAWEIIIWAKKNADGSLMTILTNSDGATNQRGIYLACTAGNKINARVGDGDGSLMVNHTSTADFTVAMGWTCIRFKRTDATNGSLQIGDNAVENFTLSGGVTNNASNLLFIGATTAGTNAFNGSIAQILMQNRVLTADEITDFKAYNPERSSANFRVVARKYDFNNASLCFQETTRSTTAADGATIALVDNDLTSNFGPYFLPIQQATAANEPTYRTGLQNGLAGLEYDGVNDNLTVTNVPPRGGSCTWYFVVSNQDNTNGSQYVDCGTNSYATLTGNDYDETSPRFVFHTDVGDEVDACGGALTPDSVNVVAYRINGGERTAFAMDGTTDSDTGVTKAWAPENFGVSHNGDTDWNHDGYSLYIEQVHGHETDAEVRANIQTLRTLYGL